MAINLYNNWGGAHRNGGILVTMKGHYFWSKRTHGNSTDNLICIYSPGWNIGTVSSIRCRNHFLNWAGFVQLLISAGNKFHSMIVSILHLLSVICRRGLSHCNLSSCILLCEYPCFSFCSSLSGLPRRTIFHRLSSEWNLVSWYIDSQLVTLRSSIIFVLLLSLKSI